MLMLMQILMPMPMLTLTLMLMLMLTLMMMDGCDHMGPRTEAHRGDGPVVHAAVIFGRLTDKGQKQKQVQN